jgi:UDP-glucose 4-epimerase
LIFEGDSFLGSHIADRLQREGHDIVSVYTHKAKLGCYPSVPHTKYHYNNSLAQIERIVNNEKPQVIIYLREEYIESISQYQSVNAAFMQILEASVKYRVKKFIYLSDISVYGKEKELFTEEDITSPETLDARCHVLAETSLSYWRPHGFFSNVLLRMSSTYGPRQNIFSRHIVWKMIRQATEKKEIHEGLSGSYSILYSGDAADAVFRSLGDFSEGIYNITPDETVDGNQIASEIHQNFVIAPPVPQPVTQQPTNASNRRAKVELGYINRVNLAKESSTVTTGSPKTPERRSPNLPRPPGNPTGPSPCVIWRPWRSSWFLP